MLSIVLKNSPCLVCAQLVTILNSQCDDTIANGPPAKESRASVEMLVDNNESTRYPRVAK